MMLARRITGITGGGRTASRALLLARDMSYSKEQEKLGRPVSPNVDVYLKHNSFPLVAISSILNRATGIGLTFGESGATPGCVRGRGQHESTDLKEAHWSLACPIHGVY